VFRTTVSCPLHKRGSYQCIFETAPHIPFCCTSLDEQVSHDQGCKIPGTFNKFPGSPEIPVGGFPEYRGNKQEIWNPPTRISGKPRNLLNVSGISQPYS
jgi:hypothetical protein